MRELKQQVVVQRRISTDDIFYMFQGLLRIPTMFAVGYTELKPEHFDQTTEIHWAILWRAAMKVAKDNNNTLPQPDSKSRSLIELEASKLVDGAPSNVTSGSLVEALFFGLDQQSGTGVINDLYTAPIESIDENKTRSILMTFLGERLVFDPLQKFIERMGSNNVPANMDKLLDEARINRERIASLEISPIEDVIPSSWATNKLQQVPTNLSFLDSAMDGGPALGEVIVMLGPTSGGKTMVALMIGVNGARYQMQEAKDGKPSGYFYYMSYESPITPDIRGRVISYAAQIHANVTMKHMTDISQLSTASSLKEYERDRWKNQLEMGEPVAGEYERYHASILQMGDRLKLLDMSGAKHPSIGTGGIEEIARVLSNAVAAGQPPVGVIIDYAGLVVDRHMSAHNERVENEFHHLNQFVNNVRVAIASRFNCVVWVLHQLHGDAAAASPTAKQHHSKARGARNFADNANFAFELGSRDPGNNCLIITCSKHRRSDSLKDPPIVRMDGPFGTLIPSDGRYALDASQKKIVEKAILDAVQDSDSVARKISKMQFKSTDSRMFGL